jgi:hypothetical protein
MWDTLVVPFLHSEVVRNLPFQVVQGKPKRVIVNRICERSA